MKSEQAFFELAKAIKESPSTPICQEVDPDLWYPEMRGNTTEASMAKKLCKRCPVIKECLQYALANRESFGIWGGLTPTERDRLLKRGRGTGKGVTGRPKAV